MDGIIVINKDKGYTSHDVVAIARKVLNTKKIGHLGTLDPNATGVLILCINDATKLSQFLEDGTKIYEAEVVFGIESNTYDIDGNILKYDHLVDLDEQKIANTLKTFLGKQLQYPPIFSAIKVNGKKLYDYARNNEEVQIKPRMIEIFDIDWDHKIYLKELTINNQLMTFKTIKVKLNVSRGTYIRSFCHDLGKKLNTIALMGELVRIKSGNFTLADCVSIDEFKNKDFMIKKMVDAIDFPKIIISSVEDEMFKKVQNGMRISYQSIKSLLNISDITNIDKVAFIYQDKILAVYVNDLEKHCYKVGRIWLLSF